MKSLSIYGTMNDKLFPDECQQYRWSRFKNFGSSDEMYEIVANGVFPFIKNLHQNGVVIIEEGVRKTTIVLFGSRAEKTNRENSDVDLIMEFLEPISLFTLSDIRLRLEEILGLEVDIIHGPIREGDLIVVGKEIELYAA